VALPCVSCSSLSTEGDSALQRVRVDESSVLVDKKQKIYHFYLQTIGFSFSNQWFFDCEPNVNVNVNVNVNENGECMIFFFTTASPSQYDYYLRARRVCVCEIDAKQFCVEPCRQKTCV